MMNFLKWLDARLGEPSTYAGLAALLAVAHVSTDAGTMHAVTFWGAGLAGVLAVVITEVGSKPPGEVAIDVLLAIGALLKSVAPPAPAATVAPPSKGDASLIIPMPPKGPTP